MSEPFSSGGWFIVRDKIPSARCSVDAQSQLRSTCPVSLPCSPSDACLGMNKCASTYTGERCSSCASTGFRVNGRCKLKYVLYAAIFMGLLAVLYMTFSIYIKVIGKGSRVNQSIHQYNLELLDFLQTIGALSKFHIAVGSSFVDTFYTAAAVFFDPSDFLFNLNNFEMNFICMQLTPVLVGGCIFIMYIIEGSLSFRRASKKTRVFCTAMESNSPQDIVKANTSYWKIAEHCFGSLRGKYIVFFLSAMLILLVPVINNGLSIFNCNRTDPDDGSFYLLSIGTNSNGLCYVSGSIQRRMALFAAVSTILYAVFIPMMCVTYAFFHECDQQCLDDSDECTESSSEDLNTKGSENRRSQSIHCHSICPLSHCGPKEGRRFWMIDCVIKKLLLCASVFWWRSVPAIALTICATVELIRLSQFIAFQPFLSRMTNKTLLSKSVALICGRKFTVTSDFNVVRCALSGAIILLCLGLTFPITMNVT